MLSERLRCSGFIITLFEKHTTGGIKRQTFKGEEIIKNASIGGKIKEIRQKRGLTQDQFAKSLGYYDKSVISHIEKGDADMTYEKILLLIKEYMLDANELFDVSEINEIDKLIEKENDRPKNDKVIIYIHGLKGSHLEAREYEYIKGYDIKGLEYQDGNPWEVKQEIIKRFEKLIKPYKEVVVIANSLGAFYTYNYLNKYSIKKAFFISPIVNMKNLIRRLIKQSNISLEELKEKNFISLKDGTVLSYDFYNKLDEYNNWNIPTEILYGKLDNIVPVDEIIGFITNNNSAKLTIKKDSSHYFASKEEKEFIKAWLIDGIK